MQWWGVDFLHHIGKVLADPQIWPDPKLENTEKDLVVRVKAVHLQSKNFDKMEVESPK